MERGDTPPHPHTHLPSHLVSALKVMLVVTDPTYDLLLSVKRTFLAHSLDPLVRNFLNLCHRDRLDESQNEARLFFFFFSFSFTCGAYRQRDFLGAFVDKIEKQPEAMFVKVLK